MKLLGLLAWFACLVIEAGATEPTGLTRSSDARTKPCLSTGGGMMEVIAVDGFKASMFDDCFETLRWTRREGHTLAQELATLVSALGGLSITPTSLAIDQRLAAKKAASCGGRGHCH